jgi:hypothetical protein
MLRSPCSEDLRWTNRLTIRRAVPIMPKVATFHESKGLSLHSAEGWP